MAGSNVVMLLQDLHCTGVLPHRRVRRIILRWTIERTPKLLLQFRPWTMHIG